jgi:predicted amidohydrolase YtcJ
MRSRLQTMTMRRLRLSRMAVRVASALLLCACIRTSPGTAAAPLETRPPSAAHEAADLIILAHIKISSGYAGALAVRHGVIVALGDPAEVEAFRGPGTQRIDLHDLTVLPGLHDVHVHPIFAGISEQQCKIPQGLSLADFQNRIRACADKVKAGGWIVGGQWDASALGRVPDRAALDLATGTHPALIDDTSGHSSWANSRALALAGITRSTSNPQGGIIERDSAGEATGILREAAADLVREHIPKPSVETMKAALAWSTHEMLSFGITSFTEAAIGFVGGSDAELAAYAALADSGGLQQRATLCLTWAPDNAEDEAAIAARNLYARPRLAPDCVKIFLDGVPTDGHTAAMLEPYAGTLAGRSDDAARFGLLLVKQSVLDKAVTRFDSMGLTVKFHAAGDAAVRAGLNAIEAARKTNGFSGLMHNVGHCTFVARSDIARARAIGATLEVSPYLWGPTPINDDIAAAVGPETIKRVWPVREMIDAGALVVPGSDWSVVPSVNPWIGIETLVTREKPGGSATSFGKAEAITLGEAMDLFTRNAARQERMANRVGRIEVGMLADLIAVEQDPYRVPISRVHDTRVRMTFIGGEKVYDAADNARTRSN